MAAFPATNEQQPNKSLPNAPFAMQPCTAFLSFGFPLVRLFKTCFCFQRKQPRRVCSFRRLTPVLCAEENNKNSLEVVKQPWSPQQQLPPTPSHRTKRWSPLVKYVSIALLCLFVGIQMLYSYVALHTIRKYIALGLVEWPGLQPGWLAPPLLLLHCLHFGTVVAGTLFISILRTLLMYLWVVVRYSVPSIAFVYIVWELVQEPRADRRSKNSLKTSPYLPKHPATIVSNSDLYSMEEIVDILRNNGLESYSQLFLDHAIDGQVLSHMTEQDLKDMGIRRIGDRKRIMLLLDMEKENSDG